MMTSILMAGISGKDFFRLFNKKTCRCPCTLAFLDNLKQHVQLPAEGKFRGV